LKFIRLSRILAPTDWLSGSGGVGRDSYHFSATSSKPRRFLSGRAAVRWNLPGWRTILQATRNSGQKAVSQQPVLGSTIAQSTDSIINSF